MQSKEVRLREAATCRGIVTKLTETLKSHNPYLFDAFWDCVMQWRCANESDYEEGLVSRSLQTLRRRGVVRYRKDYRQWEYCSHKATKEGKT